MSMPSQLMKKLFTIGGFYASYYRDYAITLAYAGNLEKANDVLAQAIDYGLTDDWFTLRKARSQRARICGMMP